MNQAPDQRGESNLKIIVASKNPVKLDATLSGFQSAFPAKRFAISGIEVDSMVSDQPFSDTETKRGATNRVAAAKVAAPEAEFWVGIEGGIEILDGQMFAFAWVIVQSAQQTGASRSGAFLLPPEVQALVHDGQELGAANDHVFGQHNSKQHNGAIGLLTHDLIGRRQLYEHATILALVPFISVELFPAQASSDC